MIIINKVALITGGAKGIGRAIALKMAENGYNLVINYRSSIHEAENVKRSCEDLGAEVVLIEADVSNESDVMSLFNQLKNHFNRLDVLVNNAGITRDGLAMRMSDEDFREVLDVNLISAFYTSREALKIMSKQRSGVIINISSVVGLRGNPGQINYAASKAGIIGMTKTLAKEMAPRNIRVNAVAPGFIKTDMTSSLTDKAVQALESQIPLNTLGTVENVADAVLFLSGESSEYITGQVLSVDGGMNI